MGSIFASMTYRGGIDLGGTKIQAVIVDEAIEVIGQARHPTPTQGGPPDVAAEIASTLREAAEAAGVETAALDGHRRRVARARSTTTPAPSRGAMNLPGWSGSFDLRDGPRATPAARRSRSATTCRSPPTPSSSSARRAPYSSVLGVFWGTGVGGGIVLDGKPWLGRDAAGEIGHVVVRIDGRRLPVRAQGLHGGVRRPPRDGDARAPRASTAARRPSLFEIMEERGRDAADERRLGARARPRRRRWPTA